MTRVCGLKCVNLDKEITIQSNTQTTDSQGGYTESWATLATDWADIQPASGFEKFQANQLQAKITHNIIIRYRSDVTAANRILYGSRTFAIKEVINMSEANTYLKIKAVE